MSTTNWRDGVPTKAQVRWLERQPLLVKLAAVEKVWQSRADQMLFYADQLWGAGREQEALGAVVEFAENAANVYQHIGVKTDFGRFASAGVKDIAGNAILRSAVVSEISIGRGEGLDTEPLMRVCERLGVVP